MQKEAKTIPTPAVASQVKAPEALATGTPSGIRYISSREHQEIKRKVLALHDGLLRKLAEHDCQRQNFDVAEVQAARAGLRNHKLACNQVLYHLRERGIERKLIPYCAGHEIEVVAYTPFGRQDWRRLHSPAGKVLAEVASRNGRTVRQTILNFLTRFPHVFTVPKAVHIEHMRENAGGAGWALSAEDLAVLDRAFPAPDRDVPLAML